MATDEMVSEETAAFVTLSLSRFVPARRDRVYAAWTNPDAMRRWMPPGTMVVTDLSVDLRVGGHYRVAMQGTMTAHEGTEELRKDMPIVSAEGVYLEIIPNELLRYTWAGSWNPSEETIVTVHFIDVEGGTEIRLTHEGFGSEQARNSHLSGWSSSIEKFTAMFSGN